jgi:hypothetical protein
LETRSKDLGIVGGDILVAVTDSLNPAGTLPASFLCHENSELLGLAVPKGRNGTWYPLVFVGMNAVSQGVLWFGGKFRDGDLEVETNSE